MARRRHAAPPEVVARPLLPVVLGPVRVGDLEVRLRPPRFSDFDPWREIRVRDRALIEPYWPSSQLDWAERHTERLWTREVLAYRAAARSGVWLAWTIEVEGRLAGQMGLSDIDQRRGSAEAGVWVDSRLARHGVASAAGAMAFDHAFFRLDIRRLVAPISVDNVPTKRGVATMGMTREAVMADYFHAGGRRQDHELWSILRRDVPPGGMVQQVLGRRAAMAISTKDVAVETEADRWPASRRAALEMLRFHAAQRRTGWADVVRALRRHPTPTLRSSSASALVLPGMEARVSGAASGERLTWQILHRGDTVGEVGLRRVRPFLQQAEVWLSMESSRQHDPAVSAEALRLVIGHAMDVLRLDRVYAVTAPGDLLAGVGPEVGLRHEGVLADHVDEDMRHGDHDLWAVTRSQRDVA